MFFQNGKAHFFTKPPYLWISQMISDYPYNKKIKSEIDQSCDFMVVGKNTMKPIYDKYENEIR